MSGIKFLLDTNILIGLLNGHQETLALLEKYQAEPASCAYSSITRLELLGWTGITPEQERQTNSLLGSMQLIPLSAAEEDAVIMLRRLRKIKLPDAIIAATAQVHALQLLTLDQKLRSLTDSH